MNIAIAVSILTCITIGFAIGYLMKDDGCSVNPLVYGIEQINELNEDYFTCSCESSKVEESFYFNQEGIRQELVNP